MTEDLEGGRPEATVRRDTSLDAQSLEAGWLRLNVRLAMEDLSDAQREALEARYLQRGGVKTYGEVAEELGITTEAAKKRCQRGMETARKSEAFEACLEFLESVKR